MQHQANSSPASLQEQQKKKNEKKWAAFKFNRQVFLLSVIKKKKKY